MVLCFSTLQNTKKSINLKRLFVNYHFKSCVFSQIELTLLQKEGDSFSSRLTSHLRKTDWLLGDTDCLIGESI